MPWDYNESRKRVCAHIEELETIVVEPLKKEADLNELLTERNCRQIYGAHLYAHPSEFSALADLPLESDAEIEFYRRIVRAVHIYQREVSYIVENVFDATRIHFQGVRLHGLVYRPIRDPQSIARRAFLQALVLSQWARDVYNPIFDTLPDINLMIGVSQGEAIGTRNGERADRELLFLGSPANHAAKILCPGTLHITETVYEHLTAEMQNTCAALGNGIYRITHRAFDFLNDWLEDEGIEWDRDASVCAKTKRATRCA